jgi:hypothetical protein
MATAGRKRAVSKLPAGGGDAAPLPQLQNEARYQKLRDATLERQLQSAVTFDKYVLSLSTGAMGLSIGFIKDVVKLDAAVHDGVLVASWVSFCVAIVATLFSYLTSQHAQAMQLRYAYEFYLRGKVEYAAKLNPWARAGDWLTHISALAFICAVILTIVFVSLNIPAR